MELNEVVEYVKNSSKTSRVYIGCDSEVVKNRKDKFARVRYTSVIIIHIDGNKGGKIFGIFDHDVVTQNERYKRDPKYRLMNEVYKVSDLYLQLAPLIEKDIEVHLDLNPDEKHLSNKVVQQALGYVKGVCGVDAVLKPDSWAASACADRWHSVLYA